MQTDTLNEKYIVFMSKETQTGVKAWLYLDIIMDIKNV